MQRIILAQPRGFCAGVDRAIEIVERALKLYGPPVYVRHEIVHNKWVVDDLRAKGVIFVDEVTEIPDGAITVFSAHGISERVENQARLRALPVVDATCPLVTKVHKEAQRYEAEGREIILIGHEGHPEVEGTSGRVKNAVHLVSSAQDVAALNVQNPEKLAYVTQTTLSVDDTRHIIDALKSRFPTIAGPELRDICYATQNRQNAVRALARQVDLLLIVGSANSSNAQRLREVAEQQGVAAYLVPDETGVDPSWLDGVRQVGVSAGASTPEVLVQRVAQRLSALGAGDVRQLPGVEESVAFRLPLAVLRPAA